MRPSGSWPSATTAKRKPPHTSSFAAPSSASWSLWPAGPRGRQVEISAEGAVSNLTCATRFHASHTRLFRGDPVRASSSTRPALPDRVCGDFPRCSSSNRQSVPAGLRPPSIPESGSNTTSVNLGVSCIGSPVCRETGPLGMVAPLTELVLDDACDRRLDLGLVVERRPAIADHLLHCRLVADAEAVGAGLLMK